MMQSYDARVIENILSARYGRVRKQQGQNGTELITRCPVCHKFKLSVNPQRGVYRCWYGCSSGPVQKLISDVNLGVFVNPFARPVEVKKSAEYISPGDLVPLTDLDDEHQAIAYLRSRKINPTYVNDVFGLRYCTRGQRFAGGLFNTQNTLVIPYYLNDALIGWQSRLLYNPDEVPENIRESMGFIKDPDGDWIVPPKYFTMPGMSKGSALWNFDWARHSELVVICEGVFDVISVGRCGVAAFGKSLSDEQISTIATYWRVAVILLDPGNADSEMRQLTTTLSRSTITVPVRLEGYEDAGEAPRKEIWRQIGVAMGNNQLIQKAGITPEKLEILI